MESLTKKVIAKPKTITTTTTTRKEIAATAIPTTTATRIMAVAASGLTGDEKVESKKTVQIKPQVKQVPSETTTTTETDTKKPSLLPKPKVKVVIPPALLQKQQQQQQIPHPHQLEQQFTPEDDDNNKEEGVYEEEATALEDMPEEYNVTAEEEHEKEIALTPSSRIPVRTANAEKRALLAGCSTLSNEDSSPSTTSDLKKSKALIK